MAPLTTMKHAPPLRIKGPNRADGTLTTTLKNTLNVIGSRLLDRMIVGDERSVSLAEQGYLQSSV